MQYWAGDRAAAERTPRRPSPWWRRPATAGCSPSRSAAGPAPHAGHRATDCVAVGERAVALARDVGDAAILSHALLNVGSARWQLGDPVAWSLMEESLRVALAAGEVEHACRSCVVLGWHQLDDLHLDDAERTLAEGISLAERHDHLGCLGYLTVELGMLKLARAAWDDAVLGGAAGTGRRPTGASRGADGARAGTGTPGRAGRRRAAGGGVGARGRAGGAAADRADRRGPVGGGLAGRRPRRRAGRRRPGPTTRRLGHVPLQAQLSYWLTRAGQAVPSIASSIPTPCRWPGAGGRRRRRAAGYPYEHAAALAESPDPRDRLAALAELDALGAAPLARLVEPGLRRLGIPMPRDRRRSPGRTRPG